MLRGRLTPSFNMWTTAEPVVGDWIRQNLGPKRIAEDVHEGALAALSLMRQAPEFKERAERLSEAMDKIVQNGVRFDAETAEAIGKAEAKHSRTGRYALWVIAASVLYFVASQS